MEATGARVQPPPVGAEKGQATPAPALRRGELSRAVLVPIDGCCRNKGDFDALHGKLGPDFRHFQEGCSSLSVSAAQRQAFSGVVPILV